MTSRIVVGVGIAAVMSLAVPLAGAIIATLPGSCSSVRVGGVADSPCGGTYYQRVSTGYRVVVF